MKLADHTDIIRRKIEQAFINKLGRLGIQSENLTNTSSLSSDESEERSRMATVLEVFIKEKGTKKEGYEKLIEELTFTFFNRLAALKVMEAHILLPEVITRRSEHGDRSFAHLAWLEQNSNGREMEAEGILPFIEFQLDLLSQEIPLFSLYHPYHLMPTAIELLGIIQSFNQVEQDHDITNDIWQSDDVLGWLYESYNNEKKKRHKEDGGKTEYNKVSIQSQVYTPKWVVKFLVDNSLGKLYLEMYPDSDIRNKYKIANAPNTRSRKIKKLTEIKLIDPSNGSGNFLLYSFDLFYDLYLDQIENYDADYDKKDVPRLIIENNLYGVDLDDRAVQLAQLGLYIKAKRKKRSIRIEHFNVVSSDFFLPEYDAVKAIFEGEDGIPERQSKIISELWEDLQSAYKFGSLIRLEEKMNLKWFGTKSKVAENQIIMFEEDNLQEYEYFRSGFFKNLSDAVAQNTAKEGQNFLNTKTQDAITFLQVMTQKYDVAVANPPYTDSADFGPELKKFVEENYKKPYKFNSNLYAVFINRCFELANENGKIALIHPLTFMYLTSFDDTRKFILQKSRIEIFIEFGLGGVFSSKVDVDVAAIVLSKMLNNNGLSFFMNLQEYKGLLIKKGIFLNAYSDFNNGIPNKHNFIIDQTQFRLIEGSPFIYTISRTLSEKFRNKTIGDFLDVKVGLQTGSNERFTRYWWEIDYNCISNDYSLDKRKWVKYSKGGPFCKWFGNNWAVVNWENNGEEIKSLVDKNGRKKARPQNEKYYFKTGISYTASGSSGVSFRLHQHNSLFDVGGSCIFTTSSYGNINYLIAFLNSNLTFYLAQTLNPTVNTQVGDLKRVPFVQPNEIIENKITLIGEFNIKTKQNICSYRIIETNFQHSPLAAFQGKSLKDRLMAYLNFENIQLTQVLINEAIINELIFEIYELRDDDREQVEAKMGVSIGALGILKEAKDAFLTELQNPIAEVIEHIQSLPIIPFEEQHIRGVKEFFTSLYYGNNDLEEFCVRHQVNPINVWFWFREANIIPQIRGAEISLEFLAETIRTLLYQDDDGIIPLAGLPGEEALSQRIEEYCLQNGFTSAHYMQLDSMLGFDINEYLLNRFFDDLGNLFNVFRHFPKSPFIWHLSSGEHQGFEAYIIIYKWNRDSLFRLKSQYISKRVESLEYRQLSLQSVNTAQSMNERELIIKQLDEIANFSRKLDELIEEGYNPILDSGVGKNIAPLQQKGMLRAAVLNAKQLDKYLKADW